jgi:hypothetical protein
LIEIHSRKEFFSILKNEKMKNRKFLGASWAHLGSLISPYLIDGKCSSAHAPNVYLHMEESVKSFTLRCAQDAPKMRPEIFQKQILKFSLCCYEKECLFLTGKILSEFSV